MADVSQIKIGSTTYDIKDSVARQTIGIPDPNYSSVGDVLTVYEDKSGNSAAFMPLTLPEGVPSYSGASSGDVLTVYEDKSGKYIDWGSSGGGGGSTINRLASYNVSFWSDGSGHAITDTNAYIYYTQFIGNGQGLNAYVVFSNVNYTGEIRIVPITYCVLDKDTYIGFDESLLPSSYNDSSLFIIYYA